MKTQTRKLFSEVSIQEFIFLLQILVILLHPCYIIYSFSNILLIQYFVKLADVIIIFLKNMEMLKIPRKQIQRLKCVVYILGLILKCKDLYFFEEISVARTYLLSFYLGLKEDNLIFLKLVLENLLLPSQLVSHTQCSVQVQDLQFLTEDTFLDIYPDMFQK